MCSWTPVSIELSELKSSLWRAYCDRSQFTFESYIKWFFLLLFLSPFFELCFYRVAVISNAFFRICSRRIERDWTFYWTSFFFVRWPMLKTGWGACPSPLNDWFLWGFIENQIVVEFDWKGWRKDENIVRPSFWGLKLWMHSECSQKSFIRSRFQQNGFNHV